MISASTEAPRINLSVSLLLVFLVAVGITGCGSSRPGEVEVTGFDPASGTYQPGDEAISSLKLKNNLSERHTFWVGYSVRDAGGTWHDAPVRQVVLKPGESALSESAWSVPEEPPPPSGPYEVVMAVWDEHPEKADEEERLAHVSRTEAFRVAGLREDFGSLDGDRWEVPSKNLGRGSLEPENVSVENGRLKLKLPANTFDGGEIESRKPYLYGTYRARMKVANAPTSITGFFLYKEPDFENEIDIEIFNDPAGRILFTTYSGGEETNSVRKNLPFDPTANFHDYRFDLYPDRAVFYVDGEEMHSFDKGLPEDPMRLHVNVWFPTWLDGEKPAKDNHTLVEWIKH